MENLTSGTTARVELAAAGVLPGDCFAGLGNSDLAAVVFDFPRLSECGFEPLSQIRWFGHFARQ